MASREISHAEFTRTHQALNRIHPDVSCVVHDFWLRTGAQAKRPAERGHSRQGAERRDSGIASQNGGATEDDI